MDHCVTSEITCWINLPYQLLKCLLFISLLRPGYAFWNPKIQKLVQTSFVLQKMLKHKVLFSFLTNASEVVTSKRTTSPNNKHHISKYAIKQLKLSFPRKVKIWGHALRKCGMLETASKHRYIWVPTDCLFLIFLLWVPRLEFCNKIGSLIAMHTVSLVSSNKLLCQVILVILHVHAIFNQPWSD